MTNFKKILSLLLTAVMLLVLFAGCGNNGQGNTTGGNSTTAPGGSQTNPEDLPDSFSYKESYTVSDEEAIAIRDQIVATAGTTKLTNEQLQMYFWMSFYDYLGTDTAMMLMYYYGVDFTQPLDKLMYDSKVGLTWQHVMLDYCLENWHRYNAVCMLADERGYEMTEEDQKYLDSIPDNLKTMAEKYKYASVDEMLKAEFGAGSTAEAFINYDFTVYKAMNFMDGLYDELAPTMEEIEKYFTENEEALKKSGITKESGNVVDVRHILITPKGGEEDIFGEIQYNEDEWEACRVEAQKIYDEWLEGEATEFTFSALANSKSEDPGSNNKGGLYTDVAKGKMVKEFNDWIFDETRKNGDHALIKTSYGYHIMYFLESEPQWERTCKKTIASERIEDLIKEATEKWPMEVDYEKIGLGHVSFNEKKDEEATQGDTTAPDTQNETTAPDSQGDTTAPA